MSAAGVLLIGALVVTLIAGGLPVADHARLAVFTSPVFLSLSALAGVLCLIACLRKRKPVHQIPFWSAHMGVVLILFGAALGRTSGLRGNLAMPVSEAVSIARLPADAGLPSIPLGFRLSVRDFDPVPHAATLVIREDGVERAEVLRVNAPVSAGGWRLYLDAYSPGPPPRVDLQLRRDPGRRFVIAGIWMLLAGTPFLCWHPFVQRRGKGGRVC